MPPVLNSAASITVKRQGTEDEPVVIVDDVLARPEIWRDVAAQSRFGRIGPHYPGLRAVVPQEAALQLRAELAAPVGDAFGLPVPPVLECYFSIVTTPPEALAPIQRLPHVDGLERERIAILIFLSAGDQGGTAFYRQRETGFETVDRERFPRFEAALQAGVAQHGLPPAAYIAGDTPLYEQVAAYPARRNRALIYHSCLLHCAHIPAGATLPADPHDGRLTINAFLFDAQASAAGQASTSLRTRSRSAGLSTSTAARP